MTGPARKVQHELIMTLELLTGDDGKLYAIVTEADETEQTPFELPAQYQSMLPMVLGQLRQMKGS